MYLVLNRYGPATLLWVVRAERDRPSGTVEVLMPGLMKGYVDRFAPDDNAHDLSFDGWLGCAATRACCIVCRNLPRRPGIGRQRRSFWRKARPGRADRSASLGPVV